MEPSAFNNLFELVMVASVIIAVVYTIYRWDDMK